MEFIDELEVVPDPLPVSWQSKLLEEPETDFLGAVRGHGENGNVVQLWYLNRRWVQAVLAAVTALFVIPLFRLTIRIEWSEWFERHVAVSWLILATVWWLFLTVSAFGSVLLVVAIIRALTQYKLVKPAA